MVLIRASSWLFYSIPTCNTKRNSNTESTANQFAPRLAFRTGSKQKYAKYCLKAALKTGPENGLVFRTAAICGNLNWARKTGLKIGPQIPQKNVQRPSCSKELYLGSLPVPNVPAAFTCHALLSNAGPTYARAKSCQHAMDNRSPLLR